MMDEILEALAKVDQVTQVLQGYCLTYSVGINAVPESLKAHYGEDLASLQADYRAEISTYFQTWAHCVDWTLQNAPEAINPLQVQ